MSKSLLILDNKPMEITAKIMRLTQNKDRKVTLMLNDELWEKFKAASLADGFKVTSKLEQMMIDYLETKGLL